MRSESLSCTERNAEKVSLPWRRLCQLLARENLDGLVVSSPENVTYVSEYWGLSHWARRGTQVYALAWPDASRSVDVVIPAALADLVTDAVAEASRPYAYDCFAVEATEPLVEPEDVRVVELADSGCHDSFEALIAVIRDRTSGGSRLAVEWSGFAAGLAERVIRALPEIEFTRADALVSELRAVKSAREIDLLRTAGRITEQAVARALEHAYPGSTETEIAKCFIRALVDEGALPETTVVGSGRRSALPNVLPSARELERGDILRFDVGCRYRHYVSDIARIAAIGHATAEQRDLYSALAVGVERAAEIVRPGVSGAEVFKAAVDAVRGNGRREYRRTHCGHGIGIANYDLPRITADSAGMLEPGMVICLETPYYRIGAFGLQVEDTFLVTEDGAERFTQAPGELPIVAA